MKKSNLILDGPLGDRLVFTGLPAAYYRLTGEKLRVASLTEKGERFWPLWEPNPYAVIVRGCKQPAPDWYSPWLLYAKLGSRWVDYYRPALIFEQMTGVRIKPTEVNPTLYLSRQTVEKRCVVSDEAGTPSRRGYPYLNDLIVSLRQYGWEVTLLRNLGYGPRQVREPDHVACFGDDFMRTVEFMRTAALFIGYESGLAQLAGALDIPYVLLCGSTSALSARHRSCVFSYDACMSPCGNIFGCGQCCLYSAPNINKHIMDTINKGVR